MRVVVYSSNPQQCVPAARAAHSADIRGTRRIIIPTSNVLNPALPCAAVAVRSIAGRNNDGFSVGKRRGNMKGTRVKRYKCLFIFSYFRLCGRVHFFNHVPSRSIGFPAFSTLAHNVCIYMYVYMWYIYNIYLLHFYFSTLAKNVFLHTFLFSCL